MSAEAILVLQAVENGHVWGLGIIAATGLSMNAVYAILRRHRDSGMLERVNGSGRGSHRHVYALTEQGRLVLDAAAPIVTAAVEPFLPTGSDDPGGRVAAGHPRR